MRDDLENRIDEYFRGALDNLNVIPPAEVWNNIADQIPKKKSRKVFLWVAVAASVSLFAAISGWNYFNRAGNVGKTEQAAQIASSQGTEPTLKKELASNSSANNTENKTAKINFNSGSLKTSGQDAIKNTIEEVVPIVAAETVKDESSPNNNEINSFAQVEKKNQPEKSSGAMASKKLTEPDDHFGLIAAIPVRSFDTPDTYGKIEMGIIAVKIDTAPVYDNIYAYQEPEITKEKLRRWAIGGQMAPLYSYRNVSEVNVPGVTKASMDQVENAMVTYASGVNVDYNATSRLTFETGVFYMKMGQQIDNIGALTHPKAARIAQSNSAFIEYAAAPPVALNSTGTIITASTPELYNLNSQTFDKSDYTVGNMAAAPADLSRKDIEQSFEFIEVPFLAKYKIINRKINVHLLGGMSTHVLINSTAKLVSDENVTDYGKTADVETFNYSSSVGFGVVYNLSRKLLFSVEPTFKYYINSFNSNSDIRLHPYAFGVYSGISFKF